MFLAPDPGNANARSASGAVAAKAKCVAITDESVAMAGDGMELPTLGRQGVERVGAVTTGARSSSVVAHQL